MADALLARATENTKFLMMDVASEKEFHINHSVNEM